MVTCHLTKLETALDQLRKSYPKLKPADAGLLASALTLTGRHALALYEGEQFRWPEDYDKLTKAMVGQLEMVQSGIETTKKATKASPEEEPVLVSVGLAPNISAGENLLEGRDDLKALLSEVIQDGVEFVYSGMDLGWQWALDRVNWSTISGGELSRRIKIKAAFTEGAIGMEMGTGTKKRSSKKAPAKAAAEVEEAPVAEEPEAVEVAAPAPEPKAEKAEKPVKAEKAKSTAAAVKEPAAEKPKEPKPKASGKAKEAEPKAKAPAAKTKEPASKAKHTAVKPKEASAKAKQTAKPKAAAPAKPSAAKAKTPPAKAKAAPAKAKAPAKRK